MIAGSRIWLHPELIGVTWSHGKYMSIDNEIRDARDDDREITLDLCYAKQQSIPPNYDTNREYLPCWLESNKIGQITAIAEDAPEQPGPRIIPGPTEVNIPVTEHHHQEPAEPPGSHDTMPARDVNIIPAAESADDDEVEIIIGGKTLSEISAESGAAAEQAAGIWSSDDTINKLVNIVQTRHIGDTLLVKLFLYIFMQRYVLNLHEHTFLTIYGETGSGKSDLVKSVVEILPKDTYLMGTGSAKYLKHKGAEFDRMVVIVDDQTMNEEYIEDIKICCSSAGRNRPVYGTINPITHQTEEYELPTQLTFIFSKVDADWGVDSEQLLNRMITGYVISSPEQQQKVRNRTFQKLTVDYIDQHDTYIDDIIYDVWKGMPEGIVIDMSYIDSHIRVVNADNRTLNSLLNLIASSAFIRQWRGSESLWREQGTHWNPESGIWEAGGITKEMLIEIPNPAAAESSSKKQSKKAKDDDKKDDISHDEPQAPAKLPRTITKRIDAPVIYADEQSAKEIISIMNILYAIQNHHQQTSGTEQGTSSPAAEPVDVNAGGNILKLTGMRKRIHDAIIQKYAQSEHQWIGYAAMERDLLLNRESIRKAVTNRGREKDTESFMPGLIVEDVSFSNDDGYGSRTMKKQHIIKWNPDDYTAGIATRAPRFEWIDDD